MQNPPTTDASRLAELINSVMGTVVIDMQPNVQQICDTLIAARPDYLMLVNAQGQIRFASGACLDLLGLSVASLGSARLTHYWWPMTGTATNNLCVRP